MRAPSLLLLASLLCGGCPPPAARPYPPPRPEELIAHLRARSAALTSVRAQAKADYLDGQNRVKISVAAIAAREDRLRIAGESSFTGPLLTLATDGKQFQLLDVRQNRFLAGQVTPCNIAQLIRVELEAKEVVEVVLGGVALPRAPRGAQVSWDPAGGGREVLTLTDELGRIETIRLDARERRWDVLEAELRDPRVPGQPLWRLRHEDFADFAIPGAGKVRLPSVTYIEDPPHKSDVRLRWKERELNPSLPEGAFQLQAPQGVPTEAATCGG